MGTLVGILLVVIAAATIIGVLWMVMREPHEQEEYYIPPAKSNASDASVREMVAENLGAEIEPTPLIDKESDEPETTA